MIRFLFSLIVIAGAVATFVLYVNPHYKNIVELRKQAGSYQLALQNAERLKQARDELQARYNTIPKEQIQAVESVLPDNVDNIRLIIQLNSIALKTGMSSLRDVDYAADAAATDPKSQAKKGNNLTGEFQIKFSTSGSYKNFLNFISEVEQNLRLADITRVVFSVAEDPTKGTTDYNQYSVTLKTYWLKN